MGVSEPLHAGIHPPGLEADTPIPPGRDPLADTPPMQCMLGYGQQVGGTPPTGMHSVWKLKWGILLRALFS